MVNVIKARKQIPSEHLAICSKCSNYSKRSNFETFKLFSSGIRIHQVSLIGVTLPSHKNCVWIAELIRFTLTKNYKTKEKLG